MFALRSPVSKGALLADEVGLGKTIEAGIVLCQYWAERKRRLLILCPASLRKQWALELQEKFNLPALSRSRRSIGRKEIRRHETPDESVRALTSHEPGVEEEQPHAQMGT